jgi:hypothetical protein
MNPQGFAEVPQDIIEGIVDQLRGHNDALRSCAVVSRSFLLPSRRNLLAIVHLDSVDKTECLHNLLVSNPGLSLHIRDLTFAIPDSISRKGFEELCAWLKSSNILASILRKVPRICYMVWGDLHSCFLDWDNFSSDLQSALLDLFQSPLLATLKIFKLWRFTPNSPDVFPHVKRLILHNVTFNDVWGSVPVTEVVMLHLEVLEVNSVIFPQTLMSNLQHLFIGSDEEPTASFAWRAIRSSPRSLERIWWNCRSQLCM